MRNRQSQISPAASQYSEYSAPRPGCGVAGVAGCWMLLDVHILWYHRNPSQTPKSEICDLFQSQHRCDADLASTLRERSCRLVMRNMWISPLKADQKSGKNSASGLKSWTESWPLLFWAGAIPNIPESWCFFHLVLSWTLVAVTTICHDLLMFRPDLCVPPSYTP